MKLEKFKAKSKNTFAQDLKFRYKAHQIISL